MKAALRLSHYFPGTSVRDFLASSRLMHLATEVLFEDSPRPAPAADLWDNEATRQLKDQGLV